jgi:hypothetical protein
MDNNIRYALTHEANGTSFVGYVKTTYDELVSKLGKPNYGPSGDHKVNCEWVLNVNGDHCCIYDWKVKETPKGVYKWHVGGYSSRPLSYLAKSFNWEILKFNF